MDAITIIVEETHGTSRLNEPVDLGVPCPKGAIFDDAQLALRDENGQFIAMQTRVMDRWSDRSCKWLLLHFHGTVAPYQRTRYTLESQPKSPSVVVQHIVTVTELAKMFRVDTGPATFFLDKVDFQPFGQVASQEINLLGPSNGLILTDHRGHTWAPIIEKCSVERSGYLTLTLLFEGSFRQTKRKASIALFFSRIQFFAGHSLVKIEFVIRNPRPAKHRGGLWDLGDPASIYFEDLSMHVSLVGERKTLFWTETPNSPLKVSDSAYLEIYQDSSGGDNWQSRNHVNRFGKVPTTFRGYRIRGSDIALEGDRAEPTLILAGADGTVAGTIRHFWQNFPKALEIKDNALVVRLFPKQYADVFELQGGEQKTHSVYLHFSPKGFSQNPLAWVHAPLIPRIDPEWYAKSRVFPFMVPETEDPNRDYVHLVHSAVEDQSSLFRRREIIDEYGWRNFGDLYADHEEVYYHGPRPVISHYNNQYDCIYGFALHYARSTDRRWFELMQELARHVIDIDIYHTLEDKPAYNGGLFWHTDHYTDAATCTHRGFSRRTKEERGLNDYGGGPCNEHLYTTGLMTYYFFTGDPKAREAVLGLAEWVIRMDDGSLAPLRFVTRGATGLASQTASRHYHGPGRGAGNSINALLDAYRLSRGQNYLAKADELVRRCIHPADSIDSIGLADIEKRWSYLVFLQVLGKYLDCRAEWDQLDYMFYYAKESLLHYARWIVKHEVPYSQAMDRVEFPTETWVIHDLRKSNVLEWAALYTTTAEREQFLTKAAFFFDNCFQDLHNYPTKTYTRPLILLLHYGCMHSYFQRYEMSPPGCYESFVRFGNPKVFRPQRQLIDKGLRLLRGIRAIPMRFRSFQASMYL
jgi:hypothetical protein